MLRKLITLISLSLFVPSAFADELPEDPTIRSVSAADVALPAPRMANGLIVITASELPAACREIGKRAVAANRVQALPARISLAGCLANAEIDQLQLIDGVESIAEIEAAIGPSLEVLDDVCANGDPATQVMATHAKAQLYAAMTSRMLNTLPAATAPTADGRALIDARRAILESMVAPWRAQRLEAYRAVVALANAHALLARNPVAQGAINESRLSLARAPRYSATQLR